ncbi:MAG: hypothetical protein JSR36_14780 [Proteobacteria bacterium]|nr:hypothetical protein [Pseudomonadota bacterium]
MPERRRRNRWAALEAFAQGRLPPGTDPRSLPRLRFDRVAQRLSRSLQAALGESVPKAGTLVITVTAPIRLPARTVAQIGTRLGQPLPPAFDGIVCGNRVRVRMLSCRARGAPRVIVFVHNPQPSVRGLLALVEAWLGD